MRRGLYAIVDPSACAGRDPEEVAAAVLRGGCSILQLRSKTLDDGAFLGLARRISARCREAGVMFVVNDRVAIAHLLGADGLHLGQDDLPLAEARRIVGDRMDIGLSTHDRDQARLAVEAGADRVGFGPVFDTETKRDSDNTVGLEQLGAIARGCPIPTVAIGGITIERARDVRATGAPLAASISAICGASNPEQAARALHAALGGTEL